MRLPWCALYWALAVDGWIGANRCVCRIGAFVEVKVNGKLPGFVGYDGSYGATVHREA